MHSSWLALWYVIFFGWFVFDLTRDFDNEVDDGTVNNLSISESEPEESNNNDNARASDSEAMAGAVDLMGVSSDSGIHQVDEAVAQAPQDDKELDINDSMSQFHCWINLTRFFDRNSTRTKHMTLAQV